jgi:hypothetical protein
MATLKITFIGSTPAPANGYRITYAPLGSSENDFVPLVPNATTTTVFIPNVDDGVNYVVRVQNDCGNGNLGPIVEFNATAPTCAQLIVNANAGRISYKRCDGSEVNNLYVTASVPISDCIRQNSLQILEGTPNLSWGNACAGTIV